MCALSGPRESFSGLTPIICREKLTFWDAILRLHLYQSYEQSQHRQPNARIPSLRVDNPKTYSKYSLWGTSMAKWKHSIYWGTDEVRGLTTKSLQHYSVWFCSS